MAKKREIRVFISSTFLDMQEERDHLNRVVFPKLRKICANRGVSFYAIDLRWGITEEESQRNRTIDICLKQVKQCVPFFIGLIGNRYGWIPERASLIEKYPWTENYNSISATEMEIRYYMQEAKERKNRSFFAVKGNELCRTDFDDNRHLELQRLRDSICAETGREPFVYESIEALGQAVYDLVMDILEQEYPADECTSQLQVAQYVKELDQYDDSDEFLRMEQENWESGGNPFLFARRDPMAFEVMEQALMRFRHVVLVEPAGTEQLCNRYVYRTITENLSYSQPKMKSILLMLDADDRLRTPLAIVEELWTGLREHIQDADRYRMPDPKIVGTERLQLFQDMIVHMLENLKTEQLMICITNLHLLNPASPWYYLSFLVLFAKSNVRLVLTTGDPHQTELLRMIGVPTRNFPIRLASSERAGFFAAMIRSLELEGKHLEKDLSDRFLKSACLKDMQSAAFISGYLKNYVIFENLSDTVLSLLNLVEEKDVYSAVWQIRQQALLKDIRFNDQERRRMIGIAGAIFRILCHFRLDEATLYHVFTEEGDAPKILYLEAFEQIRPFLIFAGSGLCVYNLVCQQALVGEFGDETYIGMGKSLTNIVLNNLNTSWCCLEDNYALLRYLVAADDTDQIIRLVTDNKWLQFVRQTDCCLLRMGWRGLKKKGLLDVKKIYTASNHINSDLSMTASREIYDLLMRMESAVAGTEAIECFLDIPYVYSTDVETGYKKNWDPADYQAVRSLRQNAAAMEDAQLRCVPSQYAEEHGLKPSVAAYMYGTICAALVKRKSLTAEDVAHYLCYASEIGNLRQIADAVLYFSELDDAFDLLW